MQGIERLIILFFIYSFIGWLMEVVVVSLVKRKLCSRGFLIGPICPIYGVSCMFITLILSNYRNDYIVLVGMSILICTILEYVTSFIMEKLFKTRWWDYTKCRFNLNGRVCLKNSIVFGVLGALVIVALNPFLIGIISKLSITTINIIVIFLTLILFIDIVISVNIVSKLKIAAETLKKDNTEEITENVRNFIKKQSYFYKRLLKAFPNFKLMDKLRKK